MRLNVDVVGFAEILLLRPYKKYEASYRLGTGIKTG